MDQRGLLEAGGAAVVSGTLATAGLWLFADSIDWVVVVGLSVGVALAAAANYRARTGHAAGVAAEAPDVTAENYEEHTQSAAGDGGATEREDRRE